MNQGCSRKELYVTMLTVLVISSFLMIVPQNISRTISSKSFITYMGMGICDVNIGVMRTQVEDAAGKVKLLMCWLRIRMLKSTLCLPVGCWTGKWMMGQ
ncbi:hypothetical protein [Anoxybacterium hadale]|uniref:hypothetical protein n=1 Tax=Anoxybacterium hadale TaxID=3408580 RepID=UPI003B002B28